MNIIEKVVSAVGTVADVILIGTQIYKSIRGKGIKEEALNEILAAETKTGNCFYLIY